MFKRKGGEKRVQYTFSAIMFIAEKSLQLPIAIDLVKDKEYFTMERGKV